MPVGTITFPTTIDSDQTLSGAANNVTVLLDQAINSSQTTIAVADTSFFPSAGFATIVDNLTTPTKIEIISYTQISGNTLQSVIRGAQGTTPQSFSTGYVEIRPTAGHHLALVDAIVAIENRLGTGSTLSLTKGGTGRAFTTMPGTDRIFFWDASANSMQLLELGTNLSITGTTLNATGGGTPPASFDAISLIMPDMYTVTPGTLTPGVFTTFTVTFNAQQKNKVLAAPTNSTDVPTFRLLTDADIPNALTITQFASVTSNGFVKTTNGDGTLSVDTNTYVTSVGLSLPNIFTVTNSPVTSSGTLTATLATQAENLVLVGPINAPAATPTFRLLEDEDIPNVLTIHKNRHLTTNGFVKTTNGDGTLAVDTATYLTGNQTITLSGDVTGSGATSITTTIANGAVTYGKIQNISATSRVLGRKTAGAGSTEELTFSEVLDFVGSAAQGDILYRGSTGWARLAAGTNGQYLQTQGAAANPQWATVVAGGTPGGSSGQVQFNSAGSFGGAAGFTYQSGASPNVTITAQNAAYVALSLVSASTPTIDVFRVSADNGTTTHFRVTSSGSPSSPGAGANSERYGAGALASAADSVAFGSGASSTLGAGVAIGRSSTAQYSGVAVGNSATAGNHCVAIGQSTTASLAGSHTVVVGRASSHSGTAGMLIGGDSTSSGNYNIAIGYNAVVSHAGSIVLGSLGAVSTAANQMVCGSSSYPIDNVFFGKGSTNASPTEATINGTGGSGSNIAGANLNLAGGRGTGTGIPGTIGLQFARAGTTGSTANALSDEWRASYSTTDTVSLTAALKTSTTNLTEAARLSAIWTTATHASRTAKWQLQLVGNAAALATVAEFDMSTTAGDTRFLIYDVDNGTLERVTVGAADSGGTGFKVLRIPN